MPKNKFSFADVFKDAKYDFAKYAVTLEKQHTDFLDVLRKYAGDKDKDVAKKAKEILKKYGL